MVLEHGVRSKNPLSILQNTEPKFRVKLLIFSIREELLKRKHTESAKKVSEVYNLIEKAHKMMDNYKTVFKSDKHIFKHFNFLEKKYAGELGQIMRLFEYNTSPEGLKRNRDHDLNKNILRISKYYGNAISNELLRFEKLKD